MNKFLWSDAYLIIAEENFQDIFDNIFEDQFIRRIFDEHDSVLRKDDFFEAIAGDLGEADNCDWLFSPKKIRDLF